MKKRTRTPLRKLKKRLTVFQSKKRNEKIKKRKTNDSKISS